MEKPSTIQWLEEPLLIPDGVYEGEILSWNDRERYVSLELQITKGPFEGRKAFLPINSSGRLAHLACDLSKSYSADTTAKKLLSILCGTQIFIEIRHESFDGIWRMNVKSISKR